jgi:molecular chaperone GrpE
MPQDSSGYETPAEGTKGDGTQVPSPETPGGGNPSPATAAAQSAYGTAKAHGAAAAAADGAVQSDTAGADGEGHEALEQDVQELIVKAEKADEYLALAQRLQADFENYRRRAARDAALAQERGIAKLAKELLPAIDNLDRALQAVAAFGAAGAEPSDAPAVAADASSAGEAAENQLVSGVKLVHAEVVAALGRAGIESFAQPGEQFDPQHHEAVAQHHVEGTPAGTLLEVYQQGYRLGDTILRPARVLVSA